MRKTVNWMSSADRVSDADYVALQRFLSHEAALLDHRRFEEWLGLLTSDLSYRVTLQVAREASEPNTEYAIIEEGIDGLKSRLAQIGTPRLTHAENPSSFTRRFVSNLEAWYGSGPRELVAHTNLLVYRSRTTLPEGGFYVGERRDLIRREGGGLLLARREVRLDHTVVFGGPVSTLF
jgi:3-phenylpropionate/cinnamic acid dioxygenase small subunit